MTLQRSSALEIAIAYHEAWTGHDFERAMTYIADDIVCDAPAGRLEGADAFRGFMGPFTTILTAAELLAAFGDDESAVLVYDTSTIPVAHAPGAEWVTARDGKIARMRIVFDRLPFEAARNRG